MHRAVRYYAIAVWRCPIALTYASDTELTPGTVVSIPYRSRQRLGMVLSETEVSGAVRRKLRAIAAVHDTRVPPSVVEVAVWASKYYGSDAGWFAQQVFWYGFEPPERYREMLELLQARAVRRPWPETGGKCTTRGRAALRALWERLPASEFCVSDVLSTMVSFLRFQSLVRRGLVELRRDAHAAGSCVENPAVLADRIPSLTEEQARAVSLVLGDLQSDHQAPAPRVLYGVTGSGKTLVYMHFAKAVMERGRQFLYLVPEIALTHALITRLRLVFPNIVAVHSGMSRWERLRIAQGVRQRLYNIVIGPRSALWLPFSDLGGIVVDEEHDASFKNGSAPRWNGRDVAIYMAHRARIPIVLGSATPSLESWRNVLQRRYALAEIRERPPGAMLPYVHVHDMTQLRRVYGFRTVLAPDLISDIRRALERQQKAIVLLNRRGYTTRVMCSACETLLLCQACQYPLVWHRSRGELRCHLCDHAQALPQACPHCGTTPKKWRHGGYGTEKLAQLLGKLIPGLRVVRLDADAAQERYHDDLLQEFFQRADCLVGTQMIAKGLDCERVTVVGVVDADAGLDFTDDPRAAERVFQLITQVVGRSGRGSHPGVAHVQVERPTHIAVVSASSHQPHLFYAEESRRRQQQDAPPWKLMIRLIWAGDEGFVRRVERLRPSLQAIVEPYRWECSEIVPPVHAMHRGLIRRVCMITGPAEQRRYVSAVVAQLRALQPEPHIDVDPYDFS